MARNTHTTTRVSRAAGFSLAEVLVALAIFTLGFVAVAALLPSGALLQRETTDDVRLQHATSSAEWILEGVGRNIQPPSNAPDEWQFAVVPDEWLISDEDAIFPPEDRTSPLSLPYWLKHDEEGSPLEGDWEPLAMRRYEWIPMIRDEADTGDPEEWWMAALVVRLPHGRHTVFEQADDDLADPRIPLFRVLDIDTSQQQDGDDHFILFDYDDITDNEGEEMLQANDRVVDSFGNVYRITGFDSDQDRILVSRIVRFEDDPDGNPAPPERVFIVIHPTGDRQTPLRGVTSKVPVEVN